MSALTQHTIGTPYMVGPVHCYTGVLDGDLVLFDTGPPTPEGKRYLQEHIDLENLRHVLITHCHIDHYGLAHWLLQNSGATLYLPYRDSLKIKGHGWRIEAMHRLLSQLGFSTTYLDSLRQIFESGVLFPPFPENYLVAEQDLPERLGIEVLACPGHSQSDLVYVGSDWAVTGDTLLKGIFQSPLLDVDLVSGERFNNYQAYCSSIVKLASLQGKTVLPSHQSQVADVRRVLRFYVTKLLGRAEQLSPCRDEENVMLLVDKVLNGRVQDVFHIFLKASEVVFMKDFLRQPELLQAALEKIGLFTEVSGLFNSAVSH